MVSEAGSQPCECTCPMCSHGLWGKCWTLWVVQGGHTSFICALCFSGHLPTYMFKMLAVCRRSGHIPHPWEKKKLFKFKSSNTAGAMGPGFRRVWLSPPPLPRLVKENMREIWTGFERTDTIKQTNKQMKQNSKVGRGPGLMRCSLWTGERKWAREGQTLDFQGFWFDAKKYELSFLLFLREDPSK